MNEERTRKCLRRVEHIRGHLGNIFLREIDLSFIKLYYLGIKNHRFVKDELNL